MLCVQTLQRCILESHPRNTSESLHDPLMLTCPSSAWSSLKAIGIQTLTFALEFVDFLLIIYPIPYHEP